MSADNGIYILGTRDGYRVEHLQAIENLDYPNELDGAKEMFGHCVVHKTTSEAFDHAHKMYKEIMSSGFPVVEYGINVIDRSDRDFPK